MTDYSRDRLGPDDEDRLPWLEPVEEEYDERGGGGGRMLIAIAVALVLIGIVVGAVMWLRGRDSATAGEGALIEAPDSYYKERPPADPAAAAAAGDEIVYSASKGNEVESVIDISGAAETPVNIDRAPAPTPAPAPAPAATKPAPAPAPASTTPAAAKPAPKAVPQPAPKAEPKPKPAVVTEPEPPIPAGGGSTIQLGAFSSPAKANAAWKSLSGRFAFLSGLTSSVVPVQSGDKTLYRLRASGGNAKDLCGRLRTAGESCSVVG